MSIRDLAEQELKDDFERAFVESAKMVLQDIEAIEKRIDKENAHIDELEARLSQLNKRDKSALYMDPIEGTYLGTNIRFKK